MALKLDGTKLVTVFGGAGFIGRHVVRALARTGCRVRAAGRRPDLAGHLQPMGAVGQIHAVQANLRYPDSVARAVAGADAVINLVAVLAESGRQTFEKVHVEGARAVARAAKAAGAEALVHVSALGADVRSRSRYGRTKALGEQAVLAEFPGAVILRPSLVFGPEDQLFNRFARMAQLTPPLIPIPLIGSGRTRFQPVYVGDVAEAVVSAVTGAARPGAVYELGGPETLTLADIMRRSLSYSGRRRWLPPLPFWFAKLLAPITPITVDQVRMLQVDNIVSRSAVDEGRTLAGLQVTSPRTVEAVVPGYLERFKARGQFAHYRA